MGEPLVPPCAPFPCGSEEGGSWGKHGFTHARTREFTIRFELPDGSVQRVRAGPEEHILDAARREGLDLPSACEMGWDLACACRVLGGEWDNSDARRYYPEDAEAGFVLICTAKPRSDLRIRTHQRDVMREYRDARGLPAPRGPWGARRP